MYKGVPCKQTKINSNILKTLRVPRVTNISFSLYNTNTQSRRQVTGTDTMISNINPLLCELILATVATFIDLSGELFEFG